MNICILTSRAEPEAFRVRGAFSHNVLASWQGLPFLNGLSLTVSLRATGDHQDVQRAGYLQRPKHPSPHTRIPAVSWGVPIVGNLNLSNLRSAVSVDVIKVPGEGLREVALRVLGAPPHCRSWLWHYLPGTIESHLQYYPISSGYDYE